MLSAGARVIVTKRFPHDAGSDDARRGFAQFSDRIQIPRHGFAP